MVLNWACLLLTCEPTCGVCTESRDSGYFPVLQLVAEEERAGSDQEARRESPSTHGARQAEDGTVPQVLPR